jgi:serine/threonine protein phosphatase 1
MMTARLAENHCIYAVGDVHGRADLLMGMLAQIQDHVAHLPPNTRTEVVMLGDYIDRGSQSAQVLDLLSIGVVPTLRLRCLRGNHETMMIAALQDPHCALVDRWLLNGGVETLASYGLRRDQVAMLDQVLPSLHRRFLKSLASSYSCGGYFFVHAGVDPRQPLTAQNEEALMWIRDPFLTHQGDFGQVVVHGHTIVEAPQALPNRIAVDTGAYRSQRLSCAVLHGDRVSFLQHSAPGIALPDHANYYG